MSTAEVTTHRLGPVDALPVGEGRAFIVGAHQIAVFRLRTGELRAISAVCPHAGGPLADGTADTTTVICPLHQYAFSLTDGACRNGDYRARTYAVHDEDGQIVVRLADPPP